MQFLAHIIIDDEKILVLAREKRKAEYFERSLKIRTSGKDGSRLNDEESHLKDSPEQLEALKRGEVVYC